MDGYYSPCGYVGMGTHTFWVGLPREGFVSYMQNRLFPFFSLEVGPNQNTSTS